MDREEMWIEDLEWIEAEGALEEALRGVLVVFDEYGKALTVRDGELGPADTPVGGGSRRIHPVPNGTT